MTEKRFESDGWTIVDNESGDTIGMIGASNLLNNLHEENQRLHGRIMEYEEQITEYTKENKHLKTILEYETRMHTKWRQEAETLIVDNNTLEEALDGCKQKFNYLIRQGVKE